MQTKLESIGFMLISFGVTLIAFNPGTSEWSFAFDKNTSVPLINMNQWVYLLVGALGFIAGLSLIVSEFVEKWAKRAIKIIRNRTVQVIIWLLFIGNYSVSVVRWIGPLNSSKIGNPATTLLVIVLLVILLMFIIRMLQSSFNKSKYDGSKTLWALKATALIFGIGGLLVVVFMGNEGVISAIKYLSIAVIILSSTFLVKEKKV